LVRPPEGEGLNQNSEPVVEENGDLSEIYDDMVHHVKSIRQLSNKRRLVQEEANDAVDWSSISRQVSNIDSTIRMLLDDYDRMTQEANNTRSRIRSLGGHPVEPPMLLSEHPRSLLK
jgi:flagellar biosynthesis chaperone FliJ